MTVVIASTEVREFRQRDGTKAMRLVLGFERAQRKMICDKMQVLRLAELTGSRSFADWPGHSVTLATAMAPNGERRWRAQRRKRHDKGNDEALLPSHG